LSTYTIFRRFGFLPEIQNNLRAKQLWGTVVNDLQMKLPSHVFDTWIKDTEANGLTEEKLEVSVPNSFVSEYLENRLYQLLQKTVQEHNPSVKEISFDLSGKTKPLSTGNTFDNFVVGPSNNLAFSAALSITKKGGKGYNPLFIYSPVGLGKTHLLQAIKEHNIKEGIKTLYVTGEQYTNEFISSIQNRSTTQFRKKYRNVDCLLIDDIHFISGKEQTQEGFFHTFNDLHNAKKQIVLSSDRPPSALSLLEDRLRSRFEWGLLADIQAPDLETRIAIIKKKATDGGLDIEDEIAESIAKLIRTNVRELEGALTRILAISELQNSRINKKLVKLALHAFSPSKKTLAGDQEKILKLTCQTFKVSPAALSGKGRTHHLALARQVAMYLLRVEAGLRYTEIGKILGNKDHSTVIHAIKKIEQLIGADPGTRSTVLYIREALYS